MSQNGQYSLELENNGALVIYVNVIGRQVWSASEIVGDRLAMQRSGSAVFYDTNGSVLFNSNTDGNGEYFELLDNAKLVVKNAQDKIIWSSGNYQGLKIIILLCLNFFKNL